MSVIRSRDNARVRRWRRLAGSSRARRSEQSVLIEGVHLIEALIEAGGAVKALLVAEGACAKAEIAALLPRCGSVPHVLSDGVFASLAGTESPAGIAAEIDLPREVPALERSHACALLDGVQDAGNVGAILRSAAAFDVRDVVLGTGCADPWSPKVLRAAMGAHFSLRIASGVDLAAWAGRFAGTLACTVARGGVPVARAELCGPVGWVFGGEGQGVSEAMMARIALKVTVPMPGRAESLNVAAAAAICFYERARQLSTSAARS